MRALMRLVEGALGRLWQGQREPGGRAARQGSARRRSCVEVVGRALRAGQS